MTNYERIKGLSKTEMARTLASVSPTLEPFSSFYCEHVCPSKVNGECCHGDEAHLPCENLSHEDDILAWLDSDIQIEE